MIYYMECYNTMFHADSIGKMYKYSYIIKNMIENYEIESIERIHANKLNGTYLIFGEILYDDKKNLISEIKPLDLDNLIKWKIVEGGMIPKIENCVDAVENGVRGVVILDGRKPHSVLHEIFSDTGSGTLIRK